MQSIQSPFAPGVIAYWPVIYIIICIVLFVLAIYAFTLFVKLAHLGIKALRIYIDKNQDKHE